MSSAFGKFSAVELVVALLLLFFAAPFVDEFKHGELIISCLIVLVLVASVLAIGGQRRTLAAASVLALLVITSRTISYFRPDLLSRVPTCICALSFCAFVVMNLIRFVLRAPRVDARVLCAGISAYMLMGLAWSAAYLLEANVRPDAFAFSAARDANHAMTGFDAFYFSLVTLTTVGFGDITPVSRVARMLTAMEAMTGLLYVAVMIARLVSLYSSRENPDPQGRE